MREFKTVNKTLIKSNNHTLKIFGRYTYSLIFFLLFIVIYNLINKEYNYIINLFKSLIVTLSISIVLDYIINLIKKNNSIKKIFKEDNIIAISLIISIFSANTSIPITILATIITLIAKIIFKNGALYPTLYGILIILSYEIIKNGLTTPLITLKNLNFITTYQELIGNNGTIISYLLGTNYHYLSPIISFVIFIYLFHKKSIKYNIIVPYILTIFGIMFIFGLINGMNIWFVIFELLTGNLLFLSIYCLTDYAITPTSSEGQITYGIILGIISSILRFIIPELSIVITLILGPLLFTKLIERISFKLRYNRKFYNFTIITLMIIILITIIALNIII